MVGRRRRQIRYIAGEFAERSFELVGRRIVADAASMTISADAGTSRSTVSQRTSSTGAPR